MPETASTAVPERLYSRFMYLAKCTARLTGHPATFFAATSAILIWAITGPFCRFSPAWQLIVNTGTTIATFLMMFLLQTTQNRGSVAVQLKLDELIRAAEGAHNVLIDLEDLEQENLDWLRAKYVVIAQRARAEASDHETGCPEVETGCESSCA